MEYTISEMIEVIRKHFNIDIYDNSLKDKYTKQINKALKIGGFEEINEDSIPLSRMRRGRKYSEEALYYVMFDDTKENYKNTVTPYEYWENESKLDNYVPVKQNSFYDSEVKLIEKERKKIFPNIDWEEEMRLSQLEDDKVVVSQEEFEQKKYEIMIRAVFDIFFVLDEEKIYKDMHAYLFDVAEHTSENRRSIDDLENFPHRYVNFKKEVDPKFKKRMKEFLNDQ